MNFQIWRRQSHELSERLTAAVSPGSVALAALALARHRMVLPGVDWLGEVLRGSVDDLLLLTDELSVQVRLNLRILLAAMLVQSGREEDGRKVMDSMREFKLWPIDSLSDLTLPWAVLLADRPELLPEWCRRTRYSGDAVGSLLASHAADEVLVKLVEAAEAARARSFIFPLIYSLRTQNRLEALQAVSALRLRDQEGECWDASRSSTGIMERLHACIGDLLAVRATAARGRAWLPEFRDSLPADSLEMEVASYHRTHLPAWREHLYRSAITAKNVPLLRFIVRTPPDENCSDDLWWMAVSALAAETSLTEVMPFIREAPAPVWKAMLLSVNAEELVERAVITGELALAAEFLDRLPAREARPLHRRLDRARVKRETVSPANPAMVFLNDSLQSIQEGRMEDAAAQALAGIRAAREIRSTITRRDALFRLVACLVSVPETGKGIPFIRRYVRDSPDNAHAFIDICAAMGPETLRLLVRKSFIASEWGHPYSLMNLAVARYFYQEGFQPAVALCLSLPEEAAEKGLDTLIECEGWDDQVSDVIQMMRLWGDGKVLPRHCLAQVEKMSGKENRSKTAELAGQLIKEITGIGGKEAAEVRAFLQGFVDRASAGKSVMAWPDVTLDRERSRRIFPDTQWLELRQDELERLTATLSPERDLRERLKEYDWKRLTLRQAAEDVLEGRQRAIQWVGISDERIKEAQRQWPKPPGPEEYFGVHVSFQDVGLVDAAKAALMKGGPPELAPWGESILRISEACLLEAPDRSPQPGTTVRLLDGLARLQFGGGLLLGFAERGRAIMSAMGNSDDREYCHRRARIFTAMEAWNLLAELLFQSPSKDDFVTDALLELAWLLPEAFFLAHRHEFARNFGMARLIIAALNERGVTHEGRPLMEAAVSGA